ncbi:hypothetical protein G6O69_07325 [Pseudenhygromyxa sp. WMMC2535]|uniref:hypothetical protein n=1 Tax=Pseudenhygromyxa sp. WMMC2535 TaxID=2712867 RepID=UPI0015558121|nr:hypothetical protein [Pseudenhygromyxa sp. WMMC2535]NVB37638.1 hypothetical protein [Pseudenhygromyxa sp. WMMC2535]
MHAGLKLQLMTLALGGLAFGCGDSAADGDGSGESDSETASASGTMDEVGDQDGSGEQGSGTMDSSTSMDDGTADDESGSTSMDGETADDESGSTSMDGETADDESGSTSMDGETADEDSSGSTTNGSTDTDQDFCNKVDFLFVIDNSISMLPEQEALTAAFPGFIEAIEDSLDTDDHILVTDTDLIGWCSPGNCANPDNLHETCEGADSYACTLELEDCDVTLGAGVVKPAGQGASNMFCDPFGGNRYIVEDEPDKVDTFDCMAHVGLAGFPSERPLDALVQAVSDPLNTAGGCNEGFLRDDAILVVTFISDDDGNNEVNSPSEAFEQVLAAKGGDLDRIVVLGLAPFEDNNCSFTEGAGDHWLEFINNFGDQGLHGPSCDDDYVPFFQSAVDVIVQACQANPQ